MSDRHRPLPRRPNTLTAAARMLQPSPHDAPHPEPWHEEAWGYRDTVGELRFAETWLANSLSRSRLFAAKRPEPGTEPEPVENGPAFDLVAKLAGGVGGQSDLLRMFAPYLLIPGQGFLVGEPRQHGESFKVVNAEDLKLGRDEADQAAYELREGETSGDWRRLPAGSLVTKVYRQHPRHRWEPDSPTRPALPILRELVLLTQHVEATATSRLAGAGDQYFPAEMELPQGWEKFVEEWVAAKSKPIRDRSLTSARVPFPMRIPGQWLQYMKDSFVTFSTPFDEQSMKLREEAIGRLANAMDMPAAILTGEQQNHWGNWQIEEAGLKLHVEPTLEIICEGLTVGYLTPGLEAASANPAAQEAIEAELADQPLAEFIIWYDTSDLRVRPDRGTAAQEAYDRFQIDGEGLRKELGLSEAEPWDPGDDTVQTQIWLTHAMSATSPLAERALRELGMIDEEPVAVPGAGPGASPPAAPPPPAPGQPPGGLPPEGERGLPPTREAPPPTEPTAPPVRRLAASADGVELVPDDVAGLSPAVALVAACYTLVDRALEVAGKRALSKMPLTARPAQNDCPARRLHVCVDTDAVVPTAMQFVDAWDSLPEIAGRLGEDLDALRATLDAYVRVLVKTRQEHTWDTLSAALGVCPCEETVT